MEAANFGLFENKKDDSLTKEIFDDKELMEEVVALGIGPEEISHYLSVLFRHKDSKDACKNCKDLNACSSSTYHLKTELVLNDAGGLTVRMGPCPLQSKVDMVKSNFIIADCPSEWIYNARPSSSKRVKTVFDAFKLAIKSETKRWVYLNGKSGTGKTYLAVSIANSLAAKGKKVAVINANTQFDEIKGMMIKNRPAAERRMADLSAVAVLIIDEFGSEYKSDYVRDQIVMPLLNSRSKNKGITIICSNYSLEDIESLYTFNRASGILAKQLVETIKRNCNGETPVADGIENYF